MAQKKKKNQTPLGIIDVVPKGNINQLIKTSTPLKTEPEQPKLFTDVETGKTSGITRPDGTTFLGAEKDIESVASSLLPEPTPGITAVQQQQELARRTELLPQIQGVTTPDTEQLRLDYAQAFGAALSTAATGAIGGAAVGAAGGAAAGAGVGAIPGAVGGAVVGGIGGFLSAFRGNLATQQQDFLTGTTATLKKGESGLRIIIQNTNMGADPISQVQAFNEGLSLIDEAHSSAKREAQEGSKFLGKDGHVELVKFETFQSLTRGTLVDQFNQALINPNPNKISLTQEQIGDLS